MEVLTDLLAVLSSVLHLRHVCWVVEDPWAHCEVLLRTPDVESFSVVPQHRGLANFFDVQRLQYSIEGM